MQPRVPLALLNTIAILAMIICMVIHVCEHDTASKGAESPTRKDGEGAEGVRTPRIAPRSDYVIRKCLVTAYCPCRRCCGRHANGRTAGKTNAWKMIGVATFWNAIPKWTIVDIPGIGKKVVDDNGSAMERSWKRGVYHIDVRMPYHYQARNYGVKYMDVKIYDEGKGK